MAGSATPTLAYPGPRSSLAKTVPKPFPVRRAKAEGWRDLGILVVAVDVEDGLTWEERELLRQIGNRLYGHRPETPESATTL